MKKIIVLMLMVTLPGCAIYNFKSSSLARAKGQIATAALMGDDVQAIFAGESAEKILTKKGDLNSIEQRLREFKTTCENPTDAKVAAGVVPILSAISKLIYDLAVDKTNKELEALKKSAVSSYSVDFILPKGGLANYQCLAVLRHDKDLNLNAVLAYRLDTRGNLLSLSPQFLWAKNTTANTREVDKDKKEQITFMSGLSLQGIGKQDNGIPVLASSGQDSKKIGQFSLGDKDPVKILDGMVIGPVPLITTPSATILRVSVTEVGDIGFDVDEKIAINKTIKEAIGPALAAGVKAYLEDE